HAMNGHEQFIAVPINAEGHRERSRPACLEFLLKRTGGEVQRTLVEQDQSRGAWSGSWPIEKLLCQGRALCADVAWAVLQALLQTPPNLCAGFDQPHRHLVSVLHHGKSGRRGPTFGHGKKCRVGTGQRLAEPKDRPNDLTNVPAAHGVPTARGKEAIN